MTWREWLAVILLGPLVAVYEATFSTFVPSFWSALHPVLFCIIISLLRERPWRALAFAALCGGILDAFSIGSMGYAFFELLLITLILWFFSRRVLTNHSLYAGMALVILARGLSALMFMLVRSVERLKDSSLFITPDWSFFLRSSVWDVVLIGGFFLINLLLSRKFVTLMSATPNRYG